MINMYFRNATYSTLPLVSSRAAKCLLTVKFIDHKGREDECVRVNTYF